MSSRTNTDRLTPSARLARGLKYSTVGPVDVTRGALGIGLDSAQSSAAWLRNRYRRGRIASQLRQDLAAAQEVIAVEVAAAQEAVAESFKEARQKPRRRPRPWVLALAGAAVLGVGAVTFSIVRRSTQPEPSPLPPSVEVTPKP